MLDEAEFREVHDLYLATFSSRRGQRPAAALKLGPINTPDIEARFRAMLERYRELTGFEETNPNAVLHHRVALYGPPCRTCGKPLRTPRARFCAACGATVSSDLAAI